MSQPVSAFIYQSNALHRPTSIARALATILVVLVHTTMGESDYAGSSGAIVLALQILCRTGVPLFVILSGQLLLQSERDEALTVFCSKRIKAVFIPFVSWSLVFLCWRQIDSREQLSAWAIFRLLVSGRIYYHLWFFVLIIKLYALTPLLRAALPHLNRIKLLCLFVVWSLGVIFPINRAIFTGAPYAVGIYTLLGFLGYYIYGGVAHKITGLGFRGSLIAFLVTWFISLVACSNLLRQGMRRDDLFSYLTPHTIVLSICLYVVVMNAPWPGRGLAGRSLSTCVSFINRAGIGIYALHPLVFELLGRIPHEQSWSASIPRLFTDICVGGSAIILSGFTTLILAKIPLWAFLFNPRLQRISTTH